MGRKTSISEPVPPARNRCVYSIFPKSHESLRFGGSALRPGNINSPRFRPRKANVRKNNLAPILGPNWSVAVKLPQLYPLWLTHRLQPIGNRQQVQISPDIDNPAEREGSPVW